MILVCTVRRCSCCFLPMLDAEIYNLYIMHRVEVVNYANSIVRDRQRAEDIVQDAYLRFQTGAQKQKPDNPVGYLYRIVRNLALDFKRRTVFEQQLFSNDMDGIADTLVESKSTLESEAETRDALQKVLATLPERTRIAVEMHRLGGFKLKEIAQHLGISRSLAQLLVKEGIKQCQNSVSRTLR